MAGNVSCYTKPRKNNKKSRGNSISSEGEEATIAIPVIVPPVEIEVALRAVPVEIHHVTVVVDHTGRALYEIPSLALPLECS